MAGGAKQEQQIRTAINEGTVPAVIQVSSSGATVSVIDHRFNVSVGNVQGGGVVISISANVTGPRVLVINLTDSALFNLSSRRLIVTLDGRTVSEAASVEQVLAPKADAPSTFILVGTSTGLQLLMSVSHFSSHVIQVLSLPLAELRNIITVSAPLLVASVLLVGGGFAAVYARRKRV